jgi:polyketide biosynthesis 3-hydroxy-3-methylglutaryl-CoA synthase-like enzyme PksG
MEVGIEKISTYCGSSFVDVSELADYRKLDTSRFNNLLIKEKTLAMPYEDPVSLAVNAARPIVDSLSERERDRIEMVICCTESSFDFSKSMSTYVHDLLRLNRNCRLFEIKNACYSGTLGLQNAVNFVLSGVSPGAKALVIASDISRFAYNKDDDVQLSDWAYVEPSSGAGAVALLVSANPEIFIIDVGANGYYGFEIMDTCRPVPDNEVGNSDISLLAYLECCESSYKEYAKRVAGSDYATTFDYLTYHVPFGGMVKAAHKSMMRKIKKARNEDIDLDFKSRVKPGLLYCQRVGNIMGATVMLSLISTIANGTFDSPKRLGIFSYGSGCCSEFFSGVVTPEGQRIVQKLLVGDKLNERRRVGMEEYEKVLQTSTELKIGTKEYQLDNFWLESLKENASDRIIYLSGIKDYHRKYAWYE